jgi:hypothetical protein
LKAQVRDLEARLAEKGKKELARKRIGAVAPLFAEERTA